MTESKIKWKINDNSKKILVSMVKLLTIGQKIRKKYKNIRLEKFRLSIGLLLLIPNKEFFFY